MAEETIPPLAHPAAPPIAPPAAPIADPPAPAAAAPAPAAEGVTIPRQQLEALLATHGRVAELEAAQRQRERDAADERVRQATLAGQAEVAVTTLRQQMSADLDTERRARQATEERAKRYALDGELSRDLAGRNLVPGAVQQLAKLWGDEFTVEAQGESFAVRTRTFQSVGDFVQQQLARPEYAHFVRSGSAGGTGGPGAQAPPSPAATPAAAPQPKNMGEAVILHMKGLARQEGNPQMDVNLPMGLKAAR